MADTISIEDYQRLYGWPRVQHKYRAKPENRDGYRFDSKKEARYFDHLKNLKATGVVVFFLRQVPFHLPGNVTYRVDYQIFFADGTVQFVDVKGYETPEFIAKCKLVEQHYPVEITLVKDV